MSTFLVGALIACGRKETTPDQRLYAAYAALTHRPVELRLTGFPHRTLATTRDAESNLLALRAASLEVIQAPAPSDLRLRAAAFTFIGRRGDAPAALQTALRANAGDGALWNDLAVHQFELARHGDNPRALGEALAAADRAIALSTAPEPRFNRAAILQAMHLGNLAATAWRAAAAREPGTPWAVEARSHVASRSQSQREAWNAARLALEQAALTGDETRIDAVVAEFAQEARTTAEGPMLATWADLYLAGKSDAAAKQLSIVRAIGNSLIRINHEALLHDAVAAIDRAATERGAVLADAHVSYKRARVLIHDRMPGRADTVMANAERLFRAGGSPMEFVARAYRVGIAFDRNQIVAATALLDSLERHLPAEHIAMRAQVQWDRARIASRRGDVYALLRHAEAAAMLYEQLHEYEFTIRMRSFIASAFTALGRAEDAWNVRLRTFADAERSGNHDLIEHVLHAAAKEEIMEKRYDVAASLFGLMLNEPARSPVRRFEALLWRAFVANRVDYAPADHAASLAGAADAIQDQELRATADADRWFAEALLRGDTHPDEALALLTRTIETRETRGLSEALPEAYVARGRLHRREGAEKEAEHDLNMALFALEQRREGVKPLALRDTFFAAADTACGELMELYARRRDFASAFVTAERCRSRTIVDLASTDRKETRVLTADEVRLRLPDEVTLLHYIELRDSLLLTVISRSAITPHIVAYPRDRLERDALALTAAMERRDEAAIDRLTRSLHASLIAPLAASVHGQRLVVCPDEVLTRIPFAALQNADGRYLIEDAPITIATSATSHVIGGSRSHRVERALLVGNPAFDSSVYNLPRLPAAEAEARELSGMYQDAVLLAGDSATSERFLREFVSRDVVHIASHAIVSPRDAALSTLVFAPGPKNNGLVYHSTIAALRLARKPLVVLAGCRTASAAGGRGSIRSLALAFLAAGSRGVVGSLWNVEDEGTRAFSRIFHRRLPDTRAADALRETQLEMIHSRHSHINNAAVWAAFQFIGYDEGGKDE